MADDSDSGPKQRTTSPGISGAFTDAYDAIQSYIKAGQAERDNDTGNTSEDEQLKRANQSTDASNGYGS